MTFYTLTAKDLEDFKDLLPSDVVQCAHRPGYFTLGAVLGPPPSDGEELAAALQFYLGSTERDDFKARVTYLFLEENAGEDIGPKLFAELKNVLEQSGVTELQIKDADLSLLLSDKAKDCKVIGQERTPRYETTVEVLTGTDLWKTEAPSYVRPLSELTDREFKGVLSDIASHTGTLALPIDIPLSPAEYQAELSSWYKTEDGAAVFLVKEDEEEGLSTVLLRAYGKDFEKGILALFNRSANAAAAVYEPDTPVHIICYTDGANRLVKKLFPTLHSEEIIEEVIAL